MGRGSSKEEGGDTDAGSGWRDAKAPGEKGASWGNGPLSLKAEKEEAEESWGSRGDGMEIGEEGDGTPESSDSLIQDAR